MKTSGNPVFTEAVRVGVKLYANTKHANELVSAMREQAALNQANVRETGMHFGFMGAAKLCGDQGAIKRFWQAREVVPIGWRP